MSINFTVGDTPWVTLRKGDPSFQLNGPYTLANRASIEVTDRCPKHIADNIVWAVEKGWVKAIAVVPKTDPTLIWDMLKEKQ